MSQTPFSLPYVRDERFVGRTLELEQIHTALQHNDVVVLRTSGEGMGTTALAIEYAHRYHQFYDEIVGGVDEEEPPWAHRYRNHSARHLIQQHHAERQRGARRVNLQLTIGSTRIGARTGKSERKQIITAADYDLSMKYPAVDVGPLHQHDALTLLGPLADRDPQGAKRLVEVTRGAPLALRLVMAVLRESREKRIRDVVSFFSTEEGASIPWAIERAFRFSWEALVDENARRILQLLSLFPARFAISMAQIVNFSSPIGDDPDLVATNISLLLQKKLLEERGDGKVSLHPRIAKLAAATVENVEEFLRDCDSKLDERLRNLDWLEDEVDSRGAKAVLGDINALRHVFYHHKIYSSHNRCTDAITELLEQIANRGKNAGRSRTLFLQQMAAGNGKDYAPDEFKELAALAQQRLEERGEPHFKWVRGQSSEQGSWSTAVFCGDECHAITAATDGRVAIWDIARAEIVDKRSLDARFHHAPAIAPVGLVVACQTNHGVELYDLLNGSSLGVVCRQGQIALAPNGRYLACMYGGNHGEITLVRYDLTQATPPAQTEINQRVMAQRDDLPKLSALGEARRIAITNDGRRVLVALSGDRLFIWEPTSGTVNVVAFNDREQRPPSLYRTWRKGSTSLVLSPHGRYAVTTGGGQMYVWDLHPNVRGRVFVELAEQDMWGGPSFETAVSDEFVVIGHGDILRIHALASGKLLSVMPIIGNSPVCATSRNGSSIIVAGSAPLFLKWIRPQNQ